MKDSIYFEQFKTVMEGDVKAKERFHSDRPQELRALTLEAQHWIHWIGCSSFVTLECREIKFSQTFNTLDEMVDFVFSKPFLKRLAAIACFSDNELTVSPQHHADTDLPYLTPSLRRFLMPDQSEMLIAIVAEMRDVASKR